jgi:hypothetical protein
MLVPQTGYWVLLQTPGRRGPGCVCSLRPQVPGAPQCRSALPVRATVPVTVANFELFKKVNLKPDSDSDSEPEVRCVGRIPRSQPPGKVPSGCLQAQQACRVS